MPDTVSLASERVSEPRDPERGLGAPARERAGGAGGAEAHRKNELAGTRSGPALVWLGKPLNG